MTAIPRIRAPRPRGFLVALLFLVVAGVVGMHGLGSHGLSGPDHMSPASPAAAATENDPAVHTGRAPSVGVAAALDRPVADPAGLWRVSPVVDDVPGRDGGHEGMPLWGMCLAVLSTLTFILALLGFVRRSPTKPLRHRPRRGPVPTPRGRSPDPPSLAQLSVLRR